MATILRKAALPAKNYTNLLKAVGNASIIMIGEASHGTHEFYKERAEITKQLILEKGVTFVAVEADWPDAYKINKYVRGEYPKENAETNALGGFKRFPRWMWRNREVLDFIVWLREFNDSQQDDSKKVGFYGMDLYSLFESAHEVIEYLKKADPEAADRAKKRYACFDRFHGDTATYGYAAAFGMKKTCEDEVKRVLAEMLQKHMKEFQKGNIDEDYWYQTYNAQVVKDAEEYYRSMFTQNTWNLRDTHMVKAVKEIMRHLNQKTSRPQKGVLWAHNSHLGDAGATHKAAKRNRETNIGELARHEWGLEKTFNIGFSTFKGRVAAADDWDEPVKFKRINEGMEGSYEKLFHQVGLDEFMLINRSNAPEEIKPDQEAVEELSKWRLERAIGVIYRPDTERQSHYFDCCLAKQFDALIHIETTQPVHPLDKTPEEAGFIDETEPETYPSGM